VWNHYFEIPEQYNRKIENDKKTVNDKKRSVFVNENEATLLRVGESSETQLAHAVT